MDNPDDSSTAHPAQRWILGAGVAGTFSLASQITRPLERLATAPQWYNWTCLAALGVLLMQFSVRGRLDERWLSGLSLASVLTFLGFCEPWSTSSEVEFASRTAQVLSTTHFGVALIALGSAWVALGIGWLCGRAVLLSLPGDGPFERGGAWLLGLLIGAFGAHGVMGYASGNSSLLLP